MISAQDIRSVVAVVPTPAKQGANHWSATDTVDLDETIRLVESLILDGAKTIMALETMGECATVSQRDYESFVDCLLSTVRGRILTFVGTTALGTHESRPQNSLRQRARRVRNSIGHPDMAAGNARHGGGFFCRHRRGVFGLPHHGLDAIVLLRNREKG